LVVAQGVAHGVAITVKNARTFQIAIDILNGVYGDELQNSMRGFKVST
jgi:hypothetical protein